MRRLTAGTLVVGVGLLVAACSSGGGDATAAPTGAPTTAPTTAPTAPPAATGAAIGVASTSLGDIVVDGQGLTLYIFTPDTAGSSTCYGDCATSWPPLLSDAAPTVGAGLEAAQFGTTTRTDGGVQVTFGGMPLYYFAGDQAAGDVNGQGLGAKWFVVGADGRMIEPPASPAAAGGVTVNLADTALGTILVDGSGVTLYLFTADSAGTSACSDGCLDNWPALVSATVPTLGPGLDAEDFATIKRTDSASQVTFYGLPLYYFAGDTAAGQTNGQGVGGKWYVVGADGKMIQ